MSKLRENTCKYVMALGALVFLCVSSSTQACDLAGHDCVKPAQAHTSAHVHPQQASDHSAHSSHHDSDEDCCQLIMGNLGDFAQAQVSTSSHHQFSSVWFLLQLADTSSGHRIGFGLREIITPPPKYSVSPPSSVVTSLNAGRAPPQKLV